MDIITEMETYARAHDVPIMEKEGIAFMLDVIQTHGCRRILEIGTAIGYSAIRMALVHEDIHVVSIERDEQRWQEACRNVEKAGLSSRITLILGDALETEIDGEFDFLFIDAAKAQYTRFFEHPAAQAGRDRAFRQSWLSRHGGRKDGAQEPRNAESGAQDQRIHRLSGTQCGI